MALRVSFTDKLYHWHIVVVVVALAVCDQVKPTCDSSVPRDGGSGFRNTLKHTGIAPDRRTILIT